MGGGGGHCHARVGGSCSNGYSSTAIAPVTQAIRSRLQPVLNVALPRCVGRGGLAQGLGIHPPPPCTLPTKHQKPSTISLIQPTTHHHQHPQTRRQHNASQQHYFQAQPPPNQSHSTTTNQANNTHANSYIHSTSTNSHKTAHLVGGGVGNDSKYHKISTEILYRHLPACAPA